MKIMDSTTLLGMVGGTLTTLSYVPQVIKAWKTRSTKDVSAGMFWLLFLGVSVWMIYGFLINSLPIILANIVSLALTCIILFFKIRYK